MNIALDVMKKVQMLIPTEVLHKFSQPVIIGGFVRDTLNSVEPKDIDILFHLEGGLDNNNEVLSKRNKPQWIKDWVDGIKDVGYDVNLITTYTNFSRRFDKAFYFIFKLHKEGEKPIDVLIGREDIKTTVDDFDCNMNQFVLDSKGNISFLGDVHPETRLVMLDESRYERAERMKEYYSKHYNKSVRL